MLIADCLLPPASWPLLADTVRGNTNVEFVEGMVLFTVVGFLMAFSVLVLGRLIRPKVGHPEKDAPYECGEPAIGTSWVQFDLRFYTVALMFIVFDVEIMLLWPWAVIFDEVGAPAFWAFLIFFLVIAIPFFYEWKFGYLDWVRAAPPANPVRPSTESPVPQRSGP